MLRIVQQNSPADAKKYYAASDYYTQGQELIGRWSGKGAERLGLSGTVDQKSFERLCDNLHPQTGEQLTVRTRGDRTVLYDFTWSVPKSVSVMYALTGNEEIVQAFRESVDETMREYVEPDMKTRVRKGGRDEDRVTGNIVSAEYIHKTARPVNGSADPHLHGHTCVFNVTWDATENRSKAGQFRDLKRDAPFFQAVMRAKLANKLQDLGFGVVRKRDDFEITGVPASVIKKFSRRTDEIDATYAQKLAPRLAKLGHGEWYEGKLKIAGVEQSVEQIVEAAKRLRILTAWEKKKLASEDGIDAASAARLAERLADRGYGEWHKGKLKVAGVEQSAKQILEAAAQRGILNAREKAELGAETREKKNKELSWGELVREWGGRLTEAERKALAAVAKRVAKPVRLKGGEKLAVDHAIEHCFTREPVVAERKLMTEALKRGVGSVTVEGTARELARRPLIRGEHGGRASATTPELNQIDKRIVAFARDGRGRLRPLADPDRPFVREWLNAGQRAAVKAVLGSRDTVTLIRGPFGSGKTKMQEELRDALREAAVPVVAVAQSGTAVDELRNEAGFDSAATIAHFVRDKKMQASIRGGVLLVDEANLVGSRDMLRLFEIVQAQDARIVPVGDIRQHRSVSAGEPMRLLQERAGLPVCEINQIIRQTHGDYRKAAEWLKDGKVKQAFAELDKLGWIREIDHAGRYWILAQGYLSTILEKKKNGEHKTALAVAPTHAEGARVTAFIRDALKQDEKLEKKEHLLPVWIPARLSDPQKADPTELAEPGTMLQFHEHVPGHKKGSRLVVGEGTNLPVAYAKQFAVYRPGELAVAEGERIRVTANGHTKDGKHALKNGMLLTVQGFTKQGDVIVDKGWVIGRDFGHLAYGYCVTSQTAEGRTVDKVFVALGSQSQPATNQRTWSVALTRGREQAVVVTDSKEELLRAIQRPDQPVSALEFAERAGRQRGWRERLWKHLAFLRRASSFRQWHERPTPVITREREREVAHGR